VGKITWISLVKGIEVDTMTVFRQQAGKIDLAGISPQDTDVFLSIHGAGLQFFAVSAYANPEKRCKKASAPKGGRLY
jgi:hypothetical protein